MSVRIRLRRVGRKKQPYFRVVVVKRDAPRDGAYIEELGFYNPRTRPAFLTMDLEKLDEWIQNGAEVSDSVRSLVRKARKGGDGDVVFTPPGDEAPRLKTAKKPERRPKSVPAEAAEAAETAETGEQAPEEEPQATADDEAEGDAEDEADAGPEAEAAVEAKAAAGAEEEGEAEAEPEPEEEAGKAEAPKADASAEESEADDEAEQEGEAAEEAEVEAEADEEKKK